MIDERFESLLTSVPGPQTAALTPPLRRRESRNVTYFDETFPVFWESARDAIVVDVDGNRYLDLTAGFGVANVGHANPRIAEAISTQAHRLMHAMGDVHPTHARTQLYDALRPHVPSGLTKWFLATTGSEAVEAAMKTAMLATGKSIFVTYRNAYHGLSFGALEVAGIEKFRTPFTPLLARRALYLDYPRAGRDELGDALDRLDALLAARHDVAALIIEPIQGRGGCIVPPRGYLPALRACCDAHGVLLIFDEIYTGFGRTGTWFAAADEGVVPDILCIGKAMGSGFPISAIVARAHVMDAWPESSGEAIHTSTFLGNPMGCAAAIATVREMERLDLAARARELGALLGRRLDALRAHASVLDVRGRGMMWGVQLRDGATTQRVVARALARGVIVVPAGPLGDVVALTPPLVISEEQLHHAVDLLDAAIEERG